MKLKSTDLRVGSSTKKPALNMTGNPPSLFDTRLQVTGEYYVMIGIGDKSAYELEVLNESPDQQLQAKNSKNEPRETNAGLA